MPVVLVRQESSLSTDANNSTINADDLAITISQPWLESGNVWIRGLMSGVARYPTASTNPHPFSIEWSASEGGLFSIYAVAEDASGNTNIPETRHHHIHLQCQ